MNSFAVDNMEPLPLMEGEGRSFRVLGFNQNQRAAFVQVLMRFTLTYVIFCYILVFVVCMFEWFLGRNFPDSLINFFECMDMHTFYVFL